MNIVLQNRRTLLFVETESRWTSESSRAKIFDDTSGAVNFCHKNRLTDMQAIMLDAPPGQNLAVALPPSFDTSSVVSEQMDLANFLVPGADADISRAN